MRAVGSLPRRAEFFSGRLVLSARAMEQEKKIGSHETITITVIKDESSLPYSLIKASEAIDIWSFGALIFHWLAGEPLFPVNGKDDITSAIDYMNIITGLNLSIRNYHIPTFMQLHDIC